MSILVNVTMAFVPGIQPAFSSLLQLLDLRVSAATLVQLSTLNS